MNKKGFTLIEIMVALSIFVILMLAIAPLLMSLLSNPKQQLASMDNIDQARLISSSFTNELRNAVMGSDGSFALVQAGDSQIIFYSSFTGGSAVEVNRIRYYILDGILYKGIIQPSGSPLVYNLSSEVVRPVISGLTNGLNPIFYYYDGNYDGGTVALAQPVNINQVKFARINLLIPNKIISDSTSSFLITAGATIRALKDNLGN